MVEQGILDLDTRLHEIAMPFEIDSPTFNGSDISFLDLATHSAGISEQNFAYGCSYYIDEGLKSLYALFDDRFTLCPSPSSPELFQPGEFLGAILDDNGALYDENHFLNVTLSETYSYSNVGAALGAEMLAVASGVDFDIWTEQQIFAPL